MTKTTGEGNIKDMEYVTVPEYAKAHDRSPATIYQWIYRGKLPAKRAYGRIIIPKNATPGKPRDIEAFEEA